MPGPQESLADACGVTVSEVGAAGIAVTVMARKGARELVYASNARAQYIDEIQFTAGVGPCLDAFSSGHEIMCPDLRDDEFRHRWLDFVDDAHGAGVAAVFAFPLRGGATIFGVYEVYRAEAGQPTPAELEAMHRGADTAAHLVLDYFASADARSGEDEDRHSLDPNGERRHIWDSRFSRPQINYAVGMISVQLDIGTRDALATLRARAFLDHRSLAEVADDIVSRHIVFGGSDGGSATER